MTANPQALLGQPGQAPLVDSTGRPTSQFAQFLASLAQRKRLTSATILYVDNVSGSDANDGSSPGAAFSTIQKAIDTISNTIDLAGFSAVIQLKAGQTFTNEVKFYPCVGRGSITLDGAGTAIISVTGGNCISSQFGAISQPITIQNIKLQTTTSGYCIIAQTPSYFIVGAGCNFGACANAHIVATVGTVQIAGNYTISGGAQQHYLSANCSVLTGTGGAITVTLTGTPAFSTCFAEATDAANIFALGLSFSGAATGQRYIATLNGVIDTVGGGANFFPGSIAGAVFSGGQYA